MEALPRRELGFKLKVIAKMMAQNMTNSITELGLTSSQGFVLRYLSCRNGETVYPRDIERQFGFSHPTVSGLLQRLEAKGFVTSRPSPEDRRCKCIVLTDKARSLDRQIARQIRAEERTMTAGMSEGEVAQLQGLLDRIIQNLASESKEGGNCL